LGIGREGEWVRERSREEWEGVWRNGKVSREEGSGPPQHGGLEPPMLLFRPDNSLPPKIPSLKSAYMVLTVTPQTPPTACRPPHLLRHTHTLVNITSPPRGAV